MNSTAKTAPITSVGASSPGRRQASSGMRRQRHQAKSSAPAMTDRNAACSTGGMPALPTLTATMFRPHAAVRSAISATTRGGRAAPPRSGVGMDRTLRRPAAGVHPVDAGPAPVAGLGSVTLPC
jgi:hypothetical protein